ncbi:MAG: hypothetical protein DMF92_04785 [Acidobacteria bacterium]|nr:MAG: hypothetical protein DMF92_04785 [Acidobacteriota bacterium]
MSATGSRLRFSGEWLAAAAFLVATLVVGSLVVRELRVAPQAFSDGGEQTSTTSAGVPPEAVSVPKLMLGEANEIRVGDRGDAAVARLDAGVVLIKTTVERGPLGPREVRSYEVSGTRFILVLEPFERRGEPRVAAIYLQ